MMKGTRMRVCVCDKARREKKREREKTESVRSRKRERAKGKTRKKDFDGEYTVRESHIDLLFIAFVPRTLYQFKYALLRPMKT